MRRFAAIFVVAASLVLAACGSTSPDHHPHLSVKAGPTKGLSACADPACGSYAVVMRWDVTIPSVTGYFVFVNGSQVADVTSPTFTYSGLVCGTSYVFGVEAHDGTGNTTVPYTSPYTTPSCSGGGGGSAPSNNVAPYFCGVSSGLAGCSAITGSAVVGQTLTVSQGTWTNAPTSYTYQWDDCNTTAGQPPTTASCSPIGGATSASYTVASGDATSCSGGCALVPIVTASNGAGSGITVINGSCNVGSTPGTLGATGDANAKQTDPSIAAGCSPISAEAATTSAGEKFCTNSPVTCGYPDPLSGNAGVPPGTSLAPVGSINCTGGTSGSPRVINAVNDSGNISVASHCHINNSYITGQNITLTGGLTDVQFNNDNISGQASGDPVSSHCTFTNNDAGSNGNSSDILWEGNGSGISITNSYLHCAAEPLNGQTQATGTYIISDECWGSCGSSNHACSFNPAQNCGTTHNEAVYFDGSVGADNGLFNNDVFLEPYGQTAAFFGDDHAFGPVQGLTLENSLIAGGWGSNGAIATGAIGDGNINVLVTNNRISFLYSSSQGCGANNPTSTGDLRDDTLAAFNC